MRVPYPKHPKQILIRIVHQDVEAGILSSIKKIAEIPLNQKLDDYFLRLGYSSTYTQGIIIALMTHCKVNVDFTAHTEHLELINPHDGISAAQAITLLEDYIAEVSTIEDLKNRNKITQKIIIPRLKR